MNKNLKSLLVALVMVVVVIAAFVIFRLATSDSSEGETVVYGSQSDEVGEQQADDDEQAEVASDNGTDGIYDTTVVSQAYLSGNPDSLSGIDRDIYDRAVEIISEVITDDMSDFEKELAIHDWIVYNCTYDNRALGILSEPGENSDNPYGALCNGQAICTGYTLSFQMFMDMLEIPCLTVYASDNEGEEHAWNMVEIEGDWYYVDVTWDDPVPDSDGRLVSHQYFNVTEDYMRSTGHVWDSTGLATADSDTYSYVNGSAVEIHSYEDLSNAAAQCLEGNRGELYVIFAQDSGVTVQGYDGEYFDSTDSPAGVNYFEPLRSELGDIDVYTYVTDIGGVLGLEVSFG